MPPMEMRGYDSSDSYCIALLNLRVGVRFAGLRQRLSLITRRSLRGSPTKDVSSPPHHGAADWFLMMRLRQTLRKAGVTTISVLAG
jgi:hypothetical protein